jgi:hypothetical protein
VLLTTCLCTIILLNAKREVESNSFDYNPFNDDDDSAAAFSWLAYLKANCSPDDIPYRHFEVLRTVG